MSIGRITPRRLRWAGGTACTGGAALLALSAAWGQAGAAGSASSSTVLGVATLQGTNGSGVQENGGVNKGDVWLDNVGQPPGPGHEHDPHLACQDINLWGAKLADGSGVFTIDGWSPSGSGTGDFGRPGYHQDQAWPNTRSAPGLAPWSYNTTTGGDQVLAVINVQKLIADAIANGDAPVNSQGFHFKLQFSQDPQKHKTFWVNCPGSTTTSSTSSTGTVSGTSSSQVSTSSSGSSSQTETSTTGTVSGISSSNTSSETGESSSSSSSGGSSTVTSSETSTTGSVSGTSSSNTSSETGESSSSSSSTGGVSGTSSSNTTSTPTTTTTETVTSTGTVSGTTTVTQTVTSTVSGGVGGVSSSSSPTGEVSGVSTTGPTGGVAGVSTTPNTGADASFLGGFGLLLAGGGLLAASRRRRS